MNTDDGPVDPATTPLFEYAGRLHVRPAWAEIRAFAANTHGQPRSGPRE